MKCPPHIFALQHAPKPVSFVRRPQKRVLAEYGSMLSLHDILDFADRFTSNIPDSLDMLWHEQQVLRIDMALLDEAPSLFRAATGIALVHEPTLVVHEAVQVPTSTCQ